ncbi:MAG: DUF116 domain-containing protein [Bacillota bacterium]|nr:DUF116 domain-containing protein [Bacillota bacterium]
MGFIYRNFTISNYNIIILLSICIFTVVTALLIITIFIIYLTYKKKRIKPVLAKFVKTGFNILFPLISLLLKMSRNNKDAIRKFYIDINNILVESGGLKFKPEDILVVLPHCLQNNECGIKITSDIKNCKRCGKCNIGEITNIMRETGIKAVVVTGGTAARNVISKSKPKIIIAVACERDLISGIFDVKNICVIGITNERPNGPCFNTFVNIEALRNRINELTN